MNLFKKISIAIGILALVLIAVALFLPAFLDANDYKDKIEELVEENLGRKLVLKGDLELKTFPNLRVKTGELTLANPSGFPHANMLEVKSAEIGIRILPLIFKKVEAGTIQIDSPLINLTKKPNGEANWKIPASKGRTDVPTREKDSSTALATIAIQGFQISDATINYADLTSNALITASNLNLTSGSIIPDAAFNVEIATQVTGSMLTDKIEARLSMQSMIDSDFSKLILSELTGEINHAESSYQFTSPLIQYDLKSSQISANELTLTAPTDEQGKAKLGVANLAFDIDQLFAKLIGTQVDYSAAELSASVSLPELSLDAENKIVSITNAEMKTSNPILNATMALPESTIDLTQDELVFNGLSGDYAFKNLNGLFSIPQLAFDKQRLQFDARNIQTTIGNSKLDADVSGALSPTLIDFKLSSENIDLRNIFESVDFKMQPGTESAFTGFMLNLSGQFQDDSLTVKQLSGKLDNTTFQGSASIKDLTNPAYQINLELGELAIDDYLPGPAAIDETETGESVTTAGGAPVSLSQFDVNANITAKRVYSDISNISLENSQLGLATKRNKSSISFKSLIKGAFVPEPIDLELNTNALINSEKSTATLDNLQLRANGQTIHAEIKIPNALIPFSAENIKLENISATFSNAAANAQLNSPELQFNAQNSTVLINNVTGKGTINNISANILLEDFAAELVSQRLSFNELALDLSGTQPVGKLSIPALEINLADQSLGATDIVFEGQDGRVELNLDPIQGSESYSGNLNTTNFNLRDFLNRFNLLTDRSNKNALTRINIQSPISLNMTKLQLENMEASVDGTRITGFVDATMGLNPVYIFDINVDQLNANQYMPSPSQAGSSSSTKTVGAPVAMPIELLQSATANGKIHFDQLEISGAQFSDLNIDLTAKGGHLSISPIESEFFSGRMDGRLTVDSSTTIPKLDFDYTLSQVALDRALSALGITDKLTGKGDFSLNMNAVGATDEALLSSVAGNANIKVNDGTIRGIDLQDVLFKGYQAYAALKDKSVNSKYNPADQTEFSSLTGNWNIKGGVISGNDLDIQAPLFRISGDGNASVIDNSIDYLLNIKVVKSLEGQGGKSMQELEGRTIPLRITGSLTEPQYRLDISSLVKAEIQRKAEEEIQKKVEDKLGENLEGEGDLKEKLQKKATEEIGKKLLDLFN